MREGTEGVLRCGGQRGQNSFYEAGLGSPTPFRSSHRSQRVRIFLFQHSGPGLPGELPPTSGHGTLAVGQPWRGGIAGGRFPLARGQIESGAAECGVRPPKAILSFDPLQAHSATHGRSRCARRWWAGPRIPLNQARPKTLPVSSDSESRPSELTVQPPHVYYSVQNTKHRKCTACSLDET